MIHFQFHEMIKQLFEIDKMSGSIYLTDGRKIDRESNTEIKMQIIAYDQGIVESKSTSISINICVLDINDNQPSFSSNLKTLFTIDENSMTFSYKVTATEPDLNLFSSILIQIMKKVLRNSSLNH